MPVPDGLVVFSDDWGRHPSSAQHLTRQLLPRYSVTWFNTIGTRPPRLDLLTLRRGIEKIGGWSRRRPVTTPEEANPRVIDPVMWPSFGSSLGRWVNRRLLSRALEESVTEPTTTVGVTTLPLVADLVGRTPLARWVYYCVDDLAEWPGLDRDTLLRMERRLVERVDAIAAVSERLVERMSQLGREAELVTHGVERSFWARPSGRMPPSLVELEKPWIVFWGVVDRRLDTAWIESLAGSLGAGTVLLIGPPNNPDPALEGIERVAQIGPVPFESLPAVASEAEALIMPYADMPATRAIQPLKLKEYLATGKPVIVSDLPACTEWSDACDVVDAAELFSRTVLRRLEEGLPEGQLDARLRLEDEGWERKADQLERLIRGAGS